MQLADQIDHRAWGGTVEPEFQGSALKPRPSYPRAVAQALLKDGLCPI